MTIINSSRTYSITDWTALKKAIELLTTAMMPVGSSIEISLAVAFSTTSVTIQSLTIPSRVSHRLPSWLSRCFQIAATPFCWTSVTKSNAPSATARPLRILSTVSWPIWSPSFFQSLSAVRPRTWSTIPRIDSNDRSAGLVMPS